MAVVGGSLIDLHSDRIEEIINKNVDVLLPSLDPCWQDTITTSQGVGPADAIGRDMKILRVFQGGLTGVLEQAQPHADFPLYGDATDNGALGSRIHTQSLVQSFPSPLTGANQSPYRLGIKMRAMVANIMFTLGELTAEATPALIGQIIAPKLEGFARNIAHQLCNYWYLNEADKFSICFNGTDGGMVNPVDTGTGPYYLTFEPGNFACDRFYPGMIVDIFANSAGVPDDTTQRAAATAIYVDYVDELKNKVRLVSATDLVNVVATDHVVYANSNTTSTFTGIAGINSWLRDGSETNTELMGADADGTDDIDVVTKTEHKSLGYDLANVALTEHTLRQLFRRFHCAKAKHGYYVDCCIASEGVWMAYEGTKIGREFIDRTTRVGGTSPQGYNSNTNFGGHSFTIDGRTYNGYTSTYVEDGTVYGIRKGGDNWKRYVPHDIKNSKPFDRNAAFIPFRFVASSLTGLSSNQLPIYGTSGATTTVTEGSQMPGWLRMQLVPEQFCGIKLKNCATDKLYENVT